MVIQDSAAVALGYHDDGDLLQTSVQKGRVARHILAAEDYGITFSIEIVTFQGPRLTIPRSSQYLNNCGVSPSGTE